LINKINAMNLLLNDLKLLLPRFSAYE